MKVLVVDDDPDLLAVTGFALERAGFVVAKAGDGIEGLARFEEESPDLVVLDINMPGLNGFELAHKLREKGDTPIVMLTVRGEEEDVVKALETGADDYLTKPFSPRVLVARIRAILRRVGAERSGVTDVGTFTLNLDDLSLSGVRQDPVKLTPLEARLLRLLAANVGQTVSTERILSHVWGTRAVTNRQLLKQLVHRLRQKIEDDPARPRLLKNVPGAGYRLDTQPSAETQSP